MWKLNQRVVLLPPNLGDVDLSRFMTSGKHSCARFSFMS